MESYNKLNDELKILMLFRCTTQEYAERFIHTGNIRFGTPKEWIDYYQKSGNGRGDLLEGCFASIPDSIKPNIAISNRNNVYIVHDELNRRYYFQSKDVLQLRTFCLFGLTTELFTQSLEGEDRNVYPTGRISKKYFSDFSDVLKEDYDNLPKEKKPVLLMIKKPQLFFERLRKMLLKIGFDENEYIIQPVRYISKNIDFYIDGQVPAELFYKDNLFNYQNEIRVVLSPQNSVIRSLIEENDGILDLGCMEDIAEIQDYYFEDFHMQLRDNNLLFTLPKPVERPITDPLEVMGYIQQIYRDEYPGSLLSISERDKLVDKAANFLKDQFNIEFCKETLTFISADGKIKWQLNKNYIWQRLFEHGRLYYERGEYEKSIDQYSKAILINPSIAVAWYNRAVSYFKTRNYYRMLSDMNKAIELDPTNEKYIKERNQQLKYLDISVDEK